MSGTWARAGLAGLMATAALLAACSNGQESQGGANPTVTTRKPQADGLSPDMVAAVAAGKTASAISVHFSLGSVPAANHVLPVKVVIVPHQEFASVRATFQSREGITVISGDQILPIQKLKPEQMITHELVVMPAGEGVHLITVGVETEAAEGVTTRIFSIPVVVMAEAPAAEGAAGGPAAAGEAADPANAPAPAASAPDSAAS